MEEFKNIIGYNGIKNELRRVLDILKNREKYLKLGVKEPHGLLLYGDPGLGKTLFANEFIKASKRKCYTCRKTKTTKEFVETLRNAFDEAVKNEPSIVFLDDMDKFSNSGRHLTNTEEYVTIQSCIDEVRDKSVYIVATANDIETLPESLKRSGRFDNLIEMRKPTGEDASKIIEYFLSKITIADEETKKNASRILSGISTAEIETIINDAGLRAGFQNKNKIEIEDIINSYIRKQYGAPESAEYDNLSYVKNIAYHEAGHAVVQEILEPETVNIVSVMNEVGLHSGITSYKTNESYFYDVEYMKNRVMSILGGKAATELIYGKIDTGCNNDLHRAFDIVERFVDHYCGYGFSSFVLDEHDEWTGVNRNTKIAQEMEKYYASAKEIIANNREFLEKIAEELEEKKILTFIDIKRIKSNINVKSLKKCA